jgi:hypothetical protein
MRGCNGRMCNCCLEMKNGGRMMLSERCDGKEVKMSCKDVVLATDVTDVKKRWTMRNKFSPSRVDE